MSEKLLEINNLKMFFESKSGVVKAVNDISFSVEKGQTVCVVGESGCGKSMTSMSIMQLLPSNGRIESGEILFEGTDLTKLSRAEMQKINGNKISIIFQEPMTSLNPVFTAGDQIAETLILHEKLSRREAKKRAIDMIDKVGIPRPEAIYDTYPHELSGGMRQRIMIAMALACNPTLLIADEPTTALDVTIQAQILDLLRKMKQDLHMSIMLITHDLGVVAEMADFVIIMYAGKIVEKGPVGEIFAHPSHPYTQGLLKSKPTILKAGSTLYSIPGQVPNLVNLPDQCYFYDRCEQCSEKCKNGVPQMYDIGNDHLVSCTLYGGNKDA
jgi:peptide/nickel transport system ATP-binding protein